MARRGVVWRAGAWHGLARLGGARQGTFHEMSPPVVGSSAAPMDAVDGSTSAIVEPADESKQRCFRVEEDEVDEMER